jgi:thiol-disulfide isomerase/thioredoxin
MALHAARSLVLGCVITACLVARSAPAAPPTDADLDRAIARFKQVFAEGSAQREDVERAAKEAMAGLDVREMSGVQLARLMSLYGILRYVGQEEAALERMRALLPDRGADGAAAAVRLMFERVRPLEGDEAKAAMLRETINHPGLEAAVRAGGADLLFGLLQAEGGTALRQLWPEVLGLERLLTPELAPRLAPGYTNYYEMLVAAAGDEHRGEVERLRKKLIELARAALPKMTDESSRDFAAKGADYLDGAFVRGQLVGHKAPALTILWSSDPAITSLDDLKGRVVVLDFWATWCGPCVASFPQVRELQERYAGYPVTIIGVTSPQGVVVGLGGKSVSAKGDPQREFALMGEYIREKDVTWPVVLTKQDASNPDYGVRGIPHVVIIDPAGVVRYRGLHPSHPMPAKAAKIDGLLKEFGLRAPPPVPAADESPR